MIRKYKNIIKYLLICLLALSLTSCTQDECIDADDFGFPKVRVPAGYKASEIMGGYDKEYVKWFDSGLKLDGHPVHLVVKYWKYLNNVNNANELSAWCPWYGPAENNPSLKDMCIFLEECTFGPEGMCRDQRSADITNAPCIFTKGVGLYALLTAPSFNPNLSVEDILRPSAGKLYHLGDKIYEADPSYNFYDLLIDPRNSTSSFVRTGGAIINYVTPAEKAAYSGGNLYFKIFDKNYADNSGQYTVVVKSGVTTTSWDPVEYIIDMVRLYLFGKPDATISSNPIDKGIVRTLFDNIVTKSDFKNTVRALLSLFIIFSAINFLIGNVQMTNTELTLRVIKILIVSQLLVSATAWDFYNKYLFTFFIDGSKSIIEIIKAAGKSGPGPSSAIPFMIAPQTLIKLSALITNSLEHLFSATGAENFGFAIVYVICFFVAFIILIIALFHAAVLYVTSLIMVSLVVILAPIFICFLLFEQTRSMFEAWLKQLISFSVQPIISVAAIAMMGIMIKHQMYSSLGFRVCKHHWTIGSYISENGLSDISGDESRSSGLYWWKPVIASNEAQVNIPIPEAHYRTSNSTMVSNSEDGEFCEPYECNGMRYPSLPFLDPQNSKELARITDFQNGRYYPLDGILIILICAYLLLKFNESAVQISQFLTNSAGGPDLGSAARRQTNSMIEGMYKAGMVAHKHGVLDKVTAFALNTTRKSLNFMSEATGLSAVNRKLNNKIVDALPESVKKNALASKFLPTRKEIAPQTTEGKLGAAIFNTTQRGFNALRNSGDTIIPESAATATMLDSEIKREYVKALSSRYKEDLVSGKGVLNAAFGKGNSDISTQIGSEVKVSGANAADGSAATANREANLGTTNRAAISAKDIAQAPLSDAEKRIAELSNALRVRGYNITDRQALSDQAFIQAAKEYGKPIRSTEFSKLSVKELKAQLLASIKAEQSLISKEEAQSLAAGAKSEIGTTGTEVSGADGITKLGNTDRTPIAANLDEKAERLNQQLRDEEQAEKDKLKGRSREDASARTSSTAGEAADSRGVTTNVRELSDEEKTEQRNRADSLVATDDITTVTEAQTRTTEALAAQSSTAETTATKAKAKESSEAIATADARQINRPEKTERAAITSRLDSLMNELRNRGASEKEINDLVESGKNGGRSEGSVAEPRLTIEVKEEYQELIKAKLEYDRKKLQNIEREFELKAEEAVLNNALKKTEKNIKDLNKVFRGFSLEEERNQAVVALEAEQQQLQAIQAGLDHVKQDKLALQQEVAEGIKEEQDLSEAAAKHNSELSSRGLSKDEITEVRRSAVEEDLTSVKEEWIEEMARRFELENPSQQSMQEKNIQLASASEVEAEEITIREDIELEKNATKLALLRQVMQEKGIDKVEIERLEKKLQKRYGIESGQDIEHIVKTKARDFALGASQLRENTERGAIRGMRQAKAVVNHVFKKEEKSSSDSTPSTPKPSTRKRK